MKTYYVDHLTSAYGRREAEPLGTFGPFLAATAREALAMFYAKHGKPDTDTEYLRCRAN